MAAKLGHTIDIVLTDEHKKDLSSVMGCIKSMHVMIFGYNVM